MNPLNLKTFGSDNHAGAHPQVLEAILKANTGLCVAYGADPYTSAAKELFQKEFGKDTSVHFVFTGTAANVISLKAVCPTYGAVICARSAHLQNDECGAPEALLGAKLFLVDTTDGKLTPTLIENHVPMSRDVHRSKPKVVSISQTTEFGTVYTLSEIRALSQFCKNNHIAFHMDGARISNAAVALNCSFREMTRESGVDLVSFGGTKNGLMGAEAILCFNPTFAESLDYTQKQFMQLSSKMRFVSCQFIAFFENELWKRNAAHANKLAAQLANRLQKVSGVKLTQATDANGVFATFTDEQLLKLKKSFYFYMWNEKMREARLMTSFSTPPEWIDEFVELISE